MKSKAKPRPLVNTPRYFRLGQAVRIVARPEPSPDAKRHNGRIGIVSGTDVLRGVMYYSVALWPATRASVPAADLIDLDSSDHCDVALACQPRPRDGRCIWCERELPIGVLATEVRDGE